MSDFAITMPIDKEIMMPIIYGMTYEQLIAHFGSQVKAASALDLKQPSISLWKERGGIPFERQCHIQLVTGGVLKASREHAPKKAVQP